MFIYHISKSGNKIVRKKTIQCIDIACMVHYNDHEPSKSFWRQPMKSITIHKLDDLLAEKIEAMAKENGESLNATIKQLLCRSLQIEPGHSSSSKKGYKK